MNCTKLKGSVYANNDWVESNLDHDCKCVVCVSSLYVEEDEPTKWAGNEPCLSIFFYHDGKVCCCSKCSGCNFNRDQDREMQLTKNINNKHCVECKCIDCVCEPQKKYAREPPIYPHWDNSCRGSCVVCRKHGWGRV